MTDGRTELRTYAPEERLLCYCGQPTLDRSDPIVETIDEGVDWDTVLELAESHGMIPKLSRALDEHCPERVPAEVSQTLRARYRSIGQKNLRFTSELLDVIELLSDHDIPVVPYRGPVLASIAYDDIALRQFNDLDLLVRRDDILQIKSLLAERGYEPSYWLQSTEDLTPSQEWAYTYFSRDYPLRSGDGVTVELHWQVVTLLLPSSITLQTVWDRRELASIQGHEIPVLGPEDRLVMLCIHGSRHYWERLSWLCDVATLLQRRSVDWEQVIEIARDNHSRRLFLLGPLLAHDVFGITIPDRIHDLASEDPRLVRLREKMRSDLFRNDISETIGVRLLQSRMLDRHRDRARFWFRWALYPERPEIERVSLYRPLVPLYSLWRVTRLLRLAGEWMAETKNNYINRSNRTFGD